VQDAELADRIQAYLVRERRPVGLSEIRRHLGLHPSDTSAISEMLHGDNRFFKVGSLWYAKDAPLKVKVRFCPNCSCKTVKFEGGFYRCPNCGIRFHFTWLA
jgi:hypothetical protein